MGQDGAQPSIHGQNVAGSGRNPLEIRALR
jgi:hypothetical protein